MAGKQTVILQQLLQEVIQDESGDPVSSRGSLTERIISVVLGESSRSGVSTLYEKSSQLAATLRTFDVRDLSVVLFGGGTGLSNIVGGDSRRREWRETPFTGLKEVFPNLHSIVCVTDDGGSTGEILKDFPFVALGDLRHVMLSSIRSTTLKEQYNLDDSAALRVAAELHLLFNYRFISRPKSVQQLLADSGVDTAVLPDLPAEYLHGLLDRLFADPRMTCALGRPQCLGNLLLAAAMYGKLSPSFRPQDVKPGNSLIRKATREGIAEFCRVIGAGNLAVLPCTTTPARLQMFYANGVLVTSETKSGVARRGYPVDRVLVEFSEQPQLSDEIVELVRSADIIIMAPGSLYTSIIPILQTPGLADLIRSNRNALKLLISNIWVQKGETDATREAPERKFYVSDLILAYGHNISGGIQDLFSHVLSLDLA
ncbi:MAG: YvcK family protein, partial [Desulfocapsa sp.]